ncbi:uncharacterized protein BJX67DRAFT_313136 [Aspergillus lucknowensis]|uniref:Uncharacterized protein n=1 Tax=Aspergillus lucknowensis TaxID=176173 RepID=A0ABR4L9G0_9EURO
MTPWLTRAYILVFFLLVTAAAAGVGKEVVLAIAAPAVEVAAATQGRQFTLLKIIMVRDGHINGQGATIMEQLTL